MRKIRYVVLCHFLHPICLKMMQFVLLCIAWSCKVVSKYSKKAHLMKILDRSYLRIRCVRSFRRRFTFMVLPMQVKKCWLQMGSLKICLSYCNQAWREMLAVAEWQNPMAVILRNAWNNQDSNQNCVFDCKKCHNSTMSQEFLHYKDRFVHHNNFCNDILPWKIEFEFSRQNYNGNRRRIDAIQT